MRQLKAGVRCGKNGVKGCPYKVHRFVLMNPEDTEKRGLCCRHYGRWYRYGDTSFLKRHAPRKGKTQ